MKTLRWLLPFTHGVDMHAIDSAVHLAESGRATLVAVSLVSMRDQSRARGARLEHIQQSKDFLEAVEWKAARYEIPVERYEVFTADVVQSMAILAHDLYCDGSILAMRGEKALLLREHEIKFLLSEPPMSMVVLHLPPNSRRTSGSYLGTKLLAWLRREPKNDGWSVQDVPKMGQEQPQELPPTMTRRGTSFHQAEVAPAELNPS